MSILHAGWNVSRNAAVKSFNIYVSEDDGQTWRLWGNTTDTKLSVSGVKTQETYRVKVCTVNQLGIASPGIVSAGLYIAGKDVPPANIPHIYLTIDSADCTKITLTWDSVTDVDLRGYQVREGKAILTPTPIADTRYVYTATASRQHNFAVYAVDNSNNLSQVPATITQMITVHPAEVTSFSCTPQDTDRSKLIMTWAPNPETNIAHYEIRTGNDGWDTAAIVATQLKATTYTFQLSSEGYQTFMIKAVNTAGYVSRTACSQTKQIFLRPNSPTDFKAEQEAKDRSVVKLSFAASSGNDIAGYEIRLGAQWNTGTFVAFVTDTTYLYQATASARHRFMLKAKTVAGFYSNVANLNPNGYIDVFVNAYDIQGFTAIQFTNDRTRIRLMWDDPRSVDIAYYEIRQGPAWDEGVILGQRVVGTFFDTTVMLEEETRFWIKAVTIEGNYSQNAAGTPPAVFSLNPAPVSNIQVTQDPNDRSVLVITFDSTPESDIVGYEVRHGYTWDTAIVVGSTLEKRIEYRPAAGGDIKIMIKAKSAAGYYSDEVYNLVPYYARLEPQNVAGFIAVQNGEYVDLYWDRPAENDIVGYEIREGGSFHYGAIVVSGLTETHYRARLELERLYTYHIKAINRSNRYSLSAATAQMNAANLPPRNVAFSRDELFFQEGTHAHTLFGPSSINWQTAGGRWSDYPTSRWVDFGSHIVLKLDRQENGAYYPSGEYVSDALDVGKLTPVELAIRFVTTATAADQTIAVLQFRTSPNGLEWSTWAEFTPAQYYLRYLQLRVILSTETPDKSPEVNIFSTMVDAPDIERAGIQQVNIGGTDIEYGYTYLNEPVLTPTVIGAGLRYEITGKTASGFRAQIFDIATGNDVGGQMDWRAKGF